MPTKKSNRNCTTSKSSRVTRSNPNPKVNFSPPEEIVKPRPKKIKVSKTQDTNLEFPLYEIPTQNCPCGKLYDSHTFENSLTQNWVHCEGDCDQWFHPRCLHIENQEWELLKSSKEKYICPACKLIKQTADLVKLSTSPYQNLIRQHLQSVFIDSFIKLHSNSQNIVQVKTPKQIQVLSSEIQKDTQLVDLNQCKENTSPKFLTPKLQSLPVPKLSFTPNLHLTSQDTLSSPVVDELKLTQKVTVKSDNQITPPIHNSPSTPDENLRVYYKNQISEDNINKPSDFIVVLDKIGTPALFHTRRQILKEVNKRKPELSVKNAIKIAGSGITLYLNSEKDRDLALEDWPEGSFNSQTVKPHLPRSQITDSNQEVFVKIPTHITPEEIKNIHPEYNSSEVKRLSKGGTQEPSTTVKIVTTKEQANLLISHGLKIRKSVYNCTPKRIIKVIRCYKCQLYGHIAATCYRDIACANCSEKHQVDNCNNKPHCKNCSDNNDHRPDSKHCHTYQQVVKNLINRSINHAQIHAAQH